MRYLSRMVATAAVAAMLVGMLASDAAAQRRGRGGGGFGPGGGGFGGGGFGGGGRLGILLQEDNRRNLELVEDQVDRLQEIQEGMRERMREEFEGLRDLPREERQEAFQKMREKMEEVTADFDKKIDDILMPEQKEKLNELVLAQSLRFGGAGGLAGNTAAAKALGLSEEQIRKLRDKQTEIRERMEKLREESEEELMGVLTPEQRERVKKLQESQQERRGRRRGNRDAV